MAPWFRHQPVLASALPISSITWTYVGKSISPPPMARGTAMWNSPASAIVSKSGRGSSRLASISSAADRIWGTSFRAASSGERPSVSRAGARELGADRGERGLLDVEGRHATELAAVLRVVERQRPMHRRALVPDHEIADAPGVTVDELPLGRVLHQVAEQQPSFGDRPVDDARLVGRQVERAPERARDGADQRMDGTFQLVLLFGRELEAEDLARMRDRVVGAKPLAERLRLGGQRVVGGAHVGELGVGRDRRYDARVEHRVPSRQILERGVGVPETIAERVLPPAIVGLHDLAVGAEVRDVGERLVAEPILRNHAAAGALVQAPVEALRERELLGIGERLVTEDEDGVFVHPRADPGQRLRVVNRAKLDRAGLTYEEWVHLPECQRHSLMRLGRPGAGSQAFARRNSRRNTAPG